MDEEVVECNAAVGWIMNGGSPLPVCDISKEALPGRQWSGTKE